MFTAKEEHESIDGLSRGIGRKKRRFVKPGKSASMERGLVKVADSMPRAEFLRVSRILSQDAGVSAGTMDLCASTQVVD